MADNPPYNTAKQTSKNRGRGGGRGQAVTSNKGKEVGNNNGVTSNRGKEVGNDRPGRGQTGNNTRGRGYNRGKGQVGNNRGRRYVNNWRTGWGHVGYNKSFHNQKMINTGPSSAYRGYDEQPYFNPQDSAPPVHSKTFTDVCSEFNPEVPPPSFVNSNVHGYFEPQMTYYNYCHYYPQVWVPEEPSGQMQVNDMGQDLAESSLEADHTSSTEPIAQMSHPVGGTQDDLSIGVAELGLVNKEELHAMNNNYQKVPYNRKQGSGMKPPDHKITDQRKTDKEHSTGDGTVENNMLNQNKGEDMIDQKIIASFAINPLSNLGRSVEQDKQLVESFAGVEMRPTTQLPQSYCLQYFYIPYGAPPPPHVIPVMVLPVISSPDNTENKSALKDDNVKGGIESVNDNEFPPPKSLLPSYISNLDLPNGSLLAPSTVEIYQPAIHTWPHQMKVPVSPGIPTDVFPQAHSSPAETQIKEVTNNNNSKQ